MKDLRFKIIADFVRDGFAKAEGAVGSLRAKFAEMFSGAGAKSWARIGAAAAAGLAAIYKAGESMRQAFLGELNKMRDEASRFSEDVNKAFRKIRFQDTEQEKAVNLERFDNRIRELKKRREELETEMATKSPLGNLLDVGEKAGRKLAGFDFEESSEAELRRNIDQTRVLERLRASAARKTTKDEEEAAKAATDAVKEAKSAQIEAAKRKHDIELAWVEEEKQALADKLDAEKKAAEASAEATRKKIADRRALIDAEREWMEEDKAAQEDLIRLRELGLEVEKAAADVAQAAKNPGRDREIGYGEFMDARRAMADAGRRGFRTDEERKKAMDALTSQGAAARAVQVAEQSKKLLEEIRDKLGMAP
jgi:phosphosulfolactate phosphohydrolase-like enzyme